MEAAKSCMDASRRHDTLSNRNREFPFFSRFVPDNFS
jgi:hypothetical protein